MSECLLKHERQHLRWKPPVHEMWHAGASFGRVRALFEDSGRTQHWLLALESWMRATFPGIEVIPDPDREFFSSMDTLRINISSSEQTRCHLNNGHKIVNKPSIVPFRCHTSEILRDIPTQACPKLQGVDVDHESESQCLYISQLFDPQEITSMLQRSIVPRPSSAKQCDNFDDSRVLSDDCTSWKGVLPWCLIGPNCLLNGHLHLASQLTKFRVQQLEAEETRRQTASKRYERLYDRRWRQSHPCMTTTPQPVFPSYLCGERAQDCSAVPCLL